MFTTIAVQAIAEDNPAVAVIASFIDPSDADEAIFSPDGKIVALQDSEMTLWEVASGLPLRRLKNPVFFTASLFTPNGATLISGHKDGDIRLWNVANGAVLATIRSRPRAASGDQYLDRITSLWLDAKGERLVSGDHGGAVTIWSLANRRPVRTVKRPATDKLGNTPTIVAAKLTADGGRLIVLTRESGNGPASVIEYDARTGVEKSSFNLPANHAFPDHGYLGDDEAIVVVSGPNCEVGELMLFSFRDRATVASIHKPAVCEEPKNGGRPEPAKAFSSPDSTRVVVARNGEPDILLWDVATRRLERTVRWPDHTSGSDVIGVSRDLKSVATTDVGRVHIRAFDTGAAVKDLRGFGGRAENVIARERGTQILLQRDPTGDDNSYVDLRAIDAVKPATVKFSRDGAFTVRDFAPKPKLALAGNDKGDVRLMSLEDGHEVRKLPVPNLKSVWTARLSPNGKAALVLGESTKEGGGVIVRIAVLLDADKGVIRQTFEAHENDENVTGFAFSPDGATFAVGRRNGSAEIWDTGAAKRLKVLPAAKKDGDVRTVEFSPDGQYLVGGGMFDSDVFIWTLATGKVVRVFDMGELVAGYGYATAVALSRDGKTLAAGLGQRAVSSGDRGAERGNIVVWNTETGKRQFTLRSQKGAIYALSFSPDGRWIVSGSLDGTIEYWDRTGGRLMATAKGGANGGWLVLTEAGFYAGSEGSDANIAVVRGSNAIAGTRVRDQLSQPDLVEQLLQGDPAGRYRDAARKLDLSAVLKSGTR